jgi:type 1 glutamine amidotransferase
MRAVVLSGGLTHDFPATSGCLARLLEEQGLTPEIHDDAEAGLRALPGAALLVVNALRWTMTCTGTPDQYRRQAAAEGVSLSPDARAALAAHLRAGGGLLGVHTASICFDDWPEWGAALGGRWIWGHSGHPPLGPPVTVRVAAAHPLVDGVGDFTIVDEVYSDLTRSPDVTGLLTAVPPGEPGTAQPLLWAREHGGGRVVYDALGHHPASYAVPQHQEILRRAIRWTAIGG